jgi:hypothetical protein
MADSQLFSNNSRAICTRCESLTKAHMVTPGSFLVEILLWLAFIFPGILYTMWRYTQKGYRCQACGSSELIPMSSPKGKVILKRQQDDKQVKPSASEATLSVNES